MDTIVHYSECWTPSNLIFIQYYFTIGNVLFQVEPINGTRIESDKFSCAKASCVFNFQLDCPGPLRVRHENQIIACHSPCVSFATDGYCCNNPPNSNTTSEICNSREWRDVEPKHFKEFCPDALTYEKDNKSVFKCKSKAYRIDFGGAF